MVEEDAGVVKAEVRRIHDQIMEITHTRVKSQQVEEKLNYSFN